MSIYPKYSDRQACANSVDSDQSVDLIYYAFDIFQKVIFCLVLYTEEVNLQTFVTI